MFGRNRLKPPNIEEKSVSIPDVETLELFTGRPSLAGPPVTPRTAMHVPAVAQAVRLISTTLGTLPFKVFKDADDGSSVPDKTHPAYKLVYKTPNAYQSAAAFRTQLTQDALLYGAGYALPGRDSNGVVVDMVRLPPWTVTPYFDQFQEPVFHVAVPGQSTVVYSHRDILYIPCGAPVEGIRHIPPIQMARDAIGLAKVLEDHASNLFRNGANPTTILKFPKALTPKAIKNLKTSWQAAHGGANSGGTAVLEDGGDVVKLGFSGAESQFEEMRRFQTEEIARAFGIPSPFLGELDRATWDNLEVLTIWLYQFALLPLITTWLGAYEHILLPDDDTHCVEAVVDDLLRPDLATQANAYAQFRSMGAMTANEVRAARKLPPLPDGDSLSNPNTTPGLAPQTKDPQK